MHRRYAAFVTAAILLLAACGGSTGATAPTTTTATGGNDTTGGNDAGTTATAAPSGTEPSSAADPADGFDGDINAILVIGDERYAFRVSCQTILTAAVGGESLPNMAVGDNEEYTLSFALANPDTDTFSKDQENISLYNRSTEQRRIADNVTEGAGIISTTFQGSIDEPIVTRAVFVDADDPAATPVSGTLEIRCGS